MPTTLEEDALDYHRRPVGGKLSVVATKPLATQRDLSLAYSPGVAAACNLIAEEPFEAANLTARGNLVGVVTNGTAVLGLGAIGPLASKPVMEGKAVLFKKFADLDAFDIEIKELDPHRFCDIVAALEPTFGAINLEDIKAPECFIIEQKLRERMQIPVFHDDQHGTAIIVAAAVRNGLAVVGKQIQDCNIVCSGAGAAALACLDLLCTLGANKDNIFVLDLHGMVYTGRQIEMDEYKARYAQDTDLRALDQVINDADVFLGLSAGDVLKPDMVARMASQPLILALANPAPEILPEKALEVRPDAIIATGRSDYPNQVNNVLCFPFIFRGALDVGATAINEEMKLACVEAIASLARKATPEAVTKAYGLENLSFGPDYVIPKPFDPRLIVEIPSAVAKAAMESGVATRPLDDFNLYREHLQRKIYKSGFVMKPLFELARADRQRLVFTDGENERVLRAVQVVVDEQLARPILIGRPDVVNSRIERLALRIEQHKDFDLCNPDNDPRFNEYVSHYLNCMGRCGVTPALAQEVVRTRRTVIAAIMVSRNEADAMIAGPVGVFEKHLDHIVGVIGLAPGMGEASTIHALVLDAGLLFLADTYVSYDPPPHEIAATAIQAANTIRRFGITPKVALLSHSNFGSRDSASAKKMRDAVQILHKNFPDLEVDGEMHADSALNEEIRSQLIKNSTLNGMANLLILPSLDTANIAYNLMKTVTGSVSVGPILVGPNLPAHIVTPSITTRGIVNMSTIACVDAISRRASD